MTVGEDAQGSVASKASLMRNLDALLSVVEEIIHGDSEYWEILHTDQHVKGFLPPLRTCTVTCSSTTILNSVTIGLHVRQCF
jgi:hypothetical protein